MKVEFLPAAADELIEAADIYESDVRGLGREFMLEVERVVGVLVELPALGEKLDEIIGASRCGASPTHLYFDTTRLSFVLSRSPIVVGAQDTGPLAFMSANVPDITAPR